MWNVLRHTVIRTTSYINGLNFQHLKRFEGNIKFRTFRTGMRLKPATTSKKKITLIATAAGLTTGAVYALYSNNQHQQEAFLNPDSEDSVTTLETLPNIRISKQVSCQTQVTDLSVELFLFWDKLIFK